MGTTLIICICDLIKSSQQLLEGINSYLHFIQEDAGVQRD